MTPESLNSHINRNIQFPGNIFRRESQSSPYESWTGQPLQVKLEDVFPMVAAQNLGSPVSHTAHIYQGRLNYILGYFTTYIDTNLALRVRDETINILRMAVMELWLLTPSLYNVNVNIVVYF